MSEAPPAESPAPREETREVPPRAPRSAASGRGAFDGVAAWAACLLPMTVTLWRASASAQWAGDGAALRDQGMTSLGFSGSVTTALTQLALLLPLGTHAFRAAMVGAFAVGVGGWALFRITRRLLELGSDASDRRSVSPSLRALLAFVAATMATLSPTWQNEATLGGGAAVAGVLLLAGVDASCELVGPMRTWMAPATTAAWLRWAALLALTGAESPPAGVALLVGSVATATTAGRIPPLRLVPALGATIVGVLLFAWAPVLLRPHAPGTFLDVAHALSAASLEPLEREGARHAAVLAWVDDVGVLALLASVAGLCIGVWKDERRAPWAPLIALLVVDLLYPMRATSSLTLDPLAALRMGGLAALAAAASVGIGDAVGFLRGLQIPMARTAAALTVVFHVTLVGLTCEEAAFAADRSRHYAAEEWTDAAFLELPHRAAVLVHSPSLAWRLWAAQSLRGQRPDVLVVPAPLLQKGEVLRHLVPTEPAVSQLLQDFALHGEASEHGMTTLADVRPLLVELDPDWDRRVIDHLKVEGAWLRFAPQRLGTSDRPVAKMHTLSIDGRIGAQMVELEVPDPSSTEVVVRTLKEHVAAMSLVGHSEDTLALVDGVERLHPNDPFVTGARLRVGHAALLRRTHRAVELRDLLRF